MEFNFRAGDYRPPPYTSPPTTIGYVSKLALPDSSLRENTNVMRKPFSLSLSCDFNESMHWELEMMRLREAKMMVEIERQRILTAETRMELMMVEREMAIQRVAPTATRRLSLYERWGMPVMHPCRGQQLQLEEQFKCLSPRQEIIGQTDKHLVQADKSKLIVLEKPESKSSTVKRKVETPLTMAGEDIHPQGVTKNHKDEWSCALCQVTAPSQRSFNQHLRGKKHKGKEAGLRAQKVSKISQAAPAPKKMRKLIEAVKTMSTAGAKQQELEVGDQSRDVSNQKTINPTLNYISSKDNADELQTQNRCIEDPKIKHDVVTIEPKSKSSEKNKLKFWCEMCGVGARFKVVMDDHLKGKKHKATLKEFGQNYGNVASVTTIESSKEIKNA